MSRITFPFSSLLWRALVLLALVGLTPLFGEEKKEEVKAPSFAFRPVHPNNRFLAIAVAEGTEPLPAGYELLQEPIKDEDGKPELDGEGQPKTSPITGGFSEAELFCKQLLAGKQSQTKK